MFQGRQGQMVLYMWLADCNIDRYQKQVTGIEKRPAFSAAVGDRELLERHNKMQLGQYDVYERSVVWN